MTKTDRWADSVTEEFNNKYWESKSIAFARISPTVIWLLAITLIVNMNGSISHAWVLPKNLRVTTVINGIAWNALQTLRKI